LSGGMPFNVMIFNDYKCRQRFFSKPSNPLISGSTHDFHHLFGSWFLHRFLPSLGIENGSILGGFGYQFWILCGILFEISFRRRFSSQRGAAPEITGQNPDHSFGQIYVSANTSN
jgi:hypothetical protein